MPTQTKPVAPTDALADFKVATPRTGGYVIADDAVRASVPAISDSAIVARGARVTSKGASVPMLLVKDGSATRGLELSAVGAAIAGGVVSVADFIGLLIPDATRAQAAIKATEAAIKEARA